MKKGFLFLAVISAVLFSMSCSDSQRTYTEMLDDEEDAIERFLDTLHIEGKRVEILRDFPADSVFEPNQFVKLDTKVYLNIIKKGSKEDRAVEYKTAIFSRFATKGLIRDTTEVNTLNNSLPNPGANLAQFTYGDFYSFAQQSIESFYIGEGVNSALKYVGNGGRVKLIVPFKRGSSTDQAAGEPRYFSDLKLFWD